MRSLPPTGAGGGPTLLALLPGGPIPAQIASGVLTGSNGETVTFARGSHVYCQASASTLVQLTNDTPCVEQTGLLIESSHSNYLQDSQFLQSSWAGNATQRLGADSSATPDGNADGVWYNVPGVTYPSGGRSWWYQTPADFVSGDDYSLSVWIKGKTTGGHLNGIAYFLGGAQPQQISPDWNYTTSWQRFRWTFSATQGGSAYVILGGNGATAGGTTFPDNYLYYWGAQLEHSSGSHSLVATTTTVPISQDRDVVTMDGSALPVAAGSVTVDFTPEWSHNFNTPALVDSRNGITGVGIALGILSSNALYLSLGRSFVVIDGGDDWEPGVTRTIKASWGAGNAAVYLDGVLMGSVTDGSAIPPSSHATLHVGSDYTNNGQVNGHISNLKFYAH